jgi:phospholipase/carboxylesterase
LETVEVSTGAEPRYSVIWLHGLGADGHDFEPVVPELGLQDSPPVRFVFPHAPVRPVTMNMGMPMRAWYDIRAISASRDQDEAGIAASHRAIDALIEREVARGVPVERQVLAGFSQGGAMALHAGLRQQSRVAGILVLSCYLLFPDRLAEERSPANAQTPVFMGHGLLDPMVPHAMGEAAAAELRRLGQPLTWRSYPIPHSVSLEELHDLGAWLRDRLA